MTPFKTPSRKMAATIALILLALFSIVLLAPLVTGRKVEFDATLVQTLITLTVLAVSFYISSTNASQEKDGTIAAQAKAALPPTTPGGTPVVHVEDNTPVRVSPTA